MPKLRLSTTVDEGLLTRARALCPTCTDASMIEDALEALLLRHHKDEVDRAYVRAYERVTVAPCTTTIRGLPSEVELDPARDPVMRTCVVSLDSLESLNLEGFIERLGTLEPGRMRQLCAALAIAVDC